MNGHLDADRIARCILGEASAAERAHLARCAACRLEVEELGQTLRAFRGSVRDWSRSELVAYESGAELAGRSAPGTPCCIAVTLLLCLMGIRISLQQPSDRQLARDGADPDSVLLERVRADVARRVPGGMEPLLNLVASGVSPGEDAQDQPLP
jgi:hypothetical protein